MDSFNIFGKSGSSKSKDRKASSSDEAASQQQPRGGEGGRGSDHAASVAGEAAAAAAPSPTPPGGCASHPPPPMVPHAHGGVGGSGSHQASAAASAAAMHDGHHHHVAAEAARSDARRANKQLEDVLRELAVKSADLATAQETVRDLSRELYVEISNVHTLNAQLAAAASELSDRDESMTLAHARIAELEERNRELEKKCDLIARGMAQGTGALGGYHRHSFADGSMHGSPALGGGGASHHQGAQGEVEEALRRRADAAEKEAYVLEGTVAGLRRMLAQTWEGEGDEVEALRARLRAHEVNVGVWERQVAAERQRCLDVAAKMQGKDEVIKSLQAQLFRRDLESGAVMVGGVGGARPNSPAVLLQPSAAAAAAAAAGDLRRSLTPVRGGYSGAGGACMPGTGVGSSSTGVGLSEGSGARGGAGAGVGLSERSGARGGAGAGVGLSEGSGAREGVGARGLLEAASSSPIPR